MPILPTHWGQWLVELFSGQRPKLYLSCNPKTPHCQGEEAVLQPVTLFVALASQTIDHKLLWALWASVRHGNMDSKELPCFFIFNLLTVGRTSVTPDGFSGHVYVGLQSPVDRYKITPRTPTISSRQTRLERPVTDVGIHTILLGCGRSGTAGVVLKTSFEKLMNSCVHTYRFRGMRPTGRRVILGGFWHWSKEPEVFSLAARFCLTYLLKI